MHHKVAAKIYCVFGPEDAALSARYVHKSLIKQLMLLVGSLCITKTRMLEVCDDRPDLLEMLEQVKVKDRRRG